MESKYKIFIAGIFMLLFFGGIKINNHFYNQKAQKDLEGEVVQSDNNAPTTTTTKATVPPVVKEIPKYTPTTPTNSEAITNPDYLKHPSDYLIDGPPNMLGKFSWGIKDQTVWVEESIDSTELKLSTVIERGGKKILKIVTFNIAWLQNFGNFGNYPVRADKEQLTTSERCWEEGARRWLQQNIVGKRITYRDEGYYYYGYSGEIYGNYRWLVEDNFGQFTIDLAAFIIINGYGKPGFLSKEAEEEYDKKSYNEGYFRQLQDLEGVASLAKRGLWATCQ